MPQSPLLESRTGSGRKWQVSTDGSVEARWRRNGKEIFYIAPDCRLIAAPIQVAGQTLEAGASVAIFQMRNVDGGTQYAVAADGQFFLINIPVDESTVSPITIVTNRARALKKYVR